MLSLGFGMEYGHAEFVLEVLINSQYVNNRYANKQLVNWSLY